MGNERIKSNLTVQERIMEYLDFLNDGYRIKYRDYDKCFSDGGKINEFWITHKDKIIRVLELINDNGYYDKAREVIFKYLEANSKEGKLSFEERIVLSRTRATQSLIRRHFSKNNSAISVASVTIPPPLSLRSIIIDSIPLLIYSFKIVSTSLQHPLSKDKISTYPILFSITFDSIVLILTFFLQKYCHILGQKKRNNLQKRLFLFNIIYLSSSKFIKLHFFTW